MPGHPEHPWLWHSLDCNPDPLAGAEQSSHNSLSFPVSSCQVPKGIFWGYHFPVVFESKVRGVLKLEEIRENISFVLNQNKTLSNG